MNGWECPGCKRCYSPMKMQCDYCGPDQLRQIAASKCFACNGYHPGMACPNWTVTSGEK